MCVCVCSVCVRVCVCVCLCLCVCVCMGVVWSWLAKWLKHLTVNLEVAGSSPHQPPPAHPALVGNWSILGFKFT